MSILQTLSWWAVVVTVPLSLCLAATGTAYTEGKAATHLLAPDRLMVSFDRPSVVADYSAAMAHYRMILSERAESNGYVANFIARGPHPWTWRAADGRTVRRIGHGVFRLTVGDCLSSLCVEIDCQDIGWPEFECSDGHTRKMAAPDLATVIFDGITYRRDLLLSR
jgi:hypothetical protein